MAKNDGLDLQLLAVSCQHDVLHMLAVLCEQNNDGWVQVVCLLGVVLVDAAVQVPREHHAVLLTCWYRPPLLVS